MAASQSIGASAAPSASKDGLIFNHDLLINPGDVEKIHQLYPKVAEFLDWPELRESFLLQDQLSKASKRRYQRRGFWTVALGVLALSLAASEPRLQGFHPWGLDAYLAIMVFLLSGASVFFGHSFMRGRVKDDWLHHRAAAERLRQLHFQWIVRRALHIATASTRKEKQELKNEREKQLVWLNERLQRGREPVVDLIVEDLAGREAWLIQKTEPVEPSGQVSLSALAELLTAYSRLRLEHQAGFATKTLSEGQRLWPWQVRGREQRLVLIAGLLTILVSRFRRLYPFVARPLTSVGTKGTLATP